jgi:dihydropyrimidine dehydrogenase (NAD+) subunit PreT
LRDGALIGTGERFSLAADQVFEAIGQTLLPEEAGDIAILRGRIDVDEEMRTSLPGVWAGGDCTGLGEDLTVVAVEQGKRAAHSIDAHLRRATRSA